MGPEAIVATQAGNSTPNAGGSKANPPRGRSAWHRRHPKQDDHGTFGENAGFQPGFMIP